MGTFRPLAGFPSVTHHYICPYNEVKDVPYSQSLEALAERETCLREGAKVCLDAVSLASAKDEP